MIPPDDFDDVIGELFCISVATVTSSTGSISAFD